MSRTLGGPAAGRHLQPTEASLSQIMADGRITTLFQPVVDLSDRRVVGYEALSRGPAGPLHSPDALFGAARSAGCNPELDVLCRDLALAAADAGGLADPYRLFLNAEPEAMLHFTAPEITSRAPVVLELTERELAARPGRLLRAVALARSLGWSIALDDMGAHPDSLALLSLLRPEVIKLDLSLIQRRPDRDCAELMSAVCAQSERTGAVIVAEGVETDEHLDLALGMGATLGQGWMFGRPAPLPSPMPTAGGSGIDLPGLEPLPELTSLYPFVTDSRMLRPGTKAFLVQLSNYLEDRAAGAGASTIVLTTFQDAVNLTPAVTRRYEQLATSCALVAVIGRSMSQHPIPGVRGGTVPVGHPLGDEWHVVVLSPDYAVALLAREYGADADGRPVMHYVLTHDRELVCTAARTLLAYVDPGIT